MCVWCEVQVMDHCFSCGDPTDPSLCTKNIILSSLHCNVTFVIKSSDNTYVGMFGALYYVPLVYLSILVLIPLLTIQLNYYGFNINLVN